MMCVIKKMKQVKRGKFTARVVRNMYKGHMDKAKGGRIEGGRWGWGGLGEGTGGRKMKTTVLEHQ